jgi:hypothetical protein
MFAKIIKFCRFLFWFILGIGLIFFSVNNRHDAELSFDPFAVNIPPIPIYFILFTGIFIGILITGLSLNWLRLIGFTERRRAERMASNLEVQVSSLSEDVHKNKAEQAHRTIDENLITDKN